MDLSSVTQSLSTEQARYVEARARGASPEVAGVAAGVGKRGGLDFEKDPAVLQAIESAQALLVVRGKPTLDELNDMLRQAWVNCQTAAEQVMVVREIGKLNDLYPGQKVKHTHQLEGGSTQEKLKQLKNLPMEELLKLSKGEITDVEYVMVETPKLTNGRKGT